MANSVRFLVIVAIFSATAGAMTLAAQSFGSRDLSKLSFVARQSLSLTVLLALGLSVVGWLIAEPALGFLNSDGDPKAVELGAAYLRILFLGTVFLTFSMVVSSLMQGAGDTITPLYINAATNILNIVFNYLLMFGPGPFPAYGVAGAAMGTVLARFMG
jgi:Na+-driven multidrug efflux pump